MEFTAAQITQVWSTLQAPAVLSVPVRPAGAEETEGGAGATEGAEGTTEGKEEAARSREVEEAEDGRAAIVVVMKATYGEMSSMFNTPHGQHPFLFATQK